MRSAVLEKVFYPKLLNQTSYSCSVFTAAEITFSWSGLAHFGCIIFSFCFVFFFYLTVNLTVFVCCVFAAKPISLVERCWCRSTLNTVPQRSIKELKFLHTPNCPFQVMWVNESVLLQRSASDVYSVAPNSLRATRAKVDLLVFRKELEEEKGTNVCFYVGQIIPEDFRVSVWTGCLSRQHLAWQRQPDLQQISQLNWYCSSRRRRLWCDILTIIPPHGAKRFHRLPQCQ